MNPKITRTPPAARRILGALVSLGFLLHYPCAPSRAQEAKAQTATTQIGGQDAQAALEEIYAGIEITTEEVRAIALRVSKNEEDSGLKLIYSENIRLPLARAADGQFTPQSVKKASQTVLKLLNQLRQQSQVPLERIFLIGSSGLGVNRSEALARAISDTTGKSLTFLDVETEIQLSVVGTISRLWKVGDTPFDNRNSSMLIEINGDRTLGGYQWLKFPPHGADGANTAPSYDFVTMDVPNRPPNAFRQALRSERESKPGLATRQRVYLTGNLPWAMVTLLYPEDRQTFVLLTSEEIERFAVRMARAPQELLTPDLSSIRDSDLRQKARSELQAVKTAFTPQQLIAGAETLRAVASEFGWQDKQIWFARHGYLGCLLSYVRLQADR
jgi:hypothetical protein